MIRWISFVWLMPSLRSSTFSADATNISMRPCHGRWQRTRQRKTVLRPFFNLVEAITIGASLLEAFMPETSDKILSQLQTEKRELSAMDQFGLYPDGGKVTDKPEILLRVWISMRLWKRLRQCVQRKLQRKRRKKNRRRQSLTSRAKTGDHLRGFCKAAVPGRRDHCL